MKCDRCQRDRVSSQLESEDNTGIHVCLDLTECSQYIDTPNTWRPWHPGLRKSWTPGFYFYWSSEGDVSVLELNGDYSTYVMGRHYAYMGTQALVYGPHPILVPEAPR